MMSNSVTPGTPAKTMLQLMQLLSTISVVFVVFALGTQLSVFQRLSSARKFYPFEPGDLSGNCPPANSRNSPQIVEESIRDQRRKDDDALQGNLVNHETKRVALAFYGLTRSLKYTIPSIKQNIFDQLTDAGIEYDVFLHTYDLTGLQNERSGESSKLNVTEWHLLKPDYVKVTSQDNFLRNYELDIKACQTFSYGNRTSASTVDYYEDDFKSFRNLMCQLNSLQTVTSMWRGANQSYDAVLYLRPDMLYNCPLPIKEVKNLQRGKVYVADFHHWHGVNDRFAMGRPDAVGLWGERLQFALSTCMREQIHAEVLVRKLLKHYQLGVEMLPFYFFRVRANGLLEDRDFKPKWKRHEVPKCDVEMFDSFIERERELSRQSEDVASRGGQ